ncbi:hypothetical protein B0H63DRAFT_525618 [Podospora didyma]|uniref:Protection of telomeres protein 1 n=1 Tax=Podospora didyma TaxID=330526 RepID=A0AAE0KKE7_9PEZI|nr:hypothetical protein B0H63DRAFT_525618 [Podospora didyma]
MPVGKPPLQASAPGALLASFTTIEDIYEDKVRMGSLINLIGLVKDWQQPFASGGKDWKSSITLLDLTTTENYLYGIKFNLFLSQADMPKVGRCDVVVLHKVKVQNYRGGLSLITHHNTTISVYTASKIPEPPASAAIALQPRSTKDKRVIKDSEHQYVSRFYHQMDKDDVPDEEVFHQKAELSLNVKQKFSLLKDVKDGNKFYDLIVQIVRDPYDDPEKVTLYASDYTTNDRFFHKKYEEDDITSRDPYNYTTGYSESSQVKKEWHGPYGQRSIQITCYEPHATFLRDVEAGQWVSLRNVQVKFGRNGQYLEGYLREDRDAPQKANAEILSTDDPDNIGPRLKDAIRRRRDYEKEKKGQIKERNNELKSKVKQIKAAEAAGAERRKSVASGSPAAVERSVSTDIRDEDSSSKNPERLSKKKRKALRAAERKEEEERLKQKSQVGLNDLITCENPGAPVSSFETILEPAYYEFKSNGQIKKIQLPFSCARYLARARVVNFFPNSLEDFTCSREISEFDVLSDNSASSSEDDSDSERSSLEDTVMAGGRRVWEWRFALELEDATPSPNSSNGRKAPKQRFWATVDNYEAQCLTGLDASNLRTDPDNLERLRLRLSTLWGDLEALKQCSARKRKRGDAANGAAKSNKRLRLGQNLQLEKPPLSSYDDAVENGAEDKDMDTDALAAEVKNIPFACCIKQFGAPYKDKDGATGWERMFGLFGTKISA